MNKRKGKIGLSLLLIVSLLTSMGFAPGVATVAASGDHDVQSITKLARIAGENRYDTAAQIALEGWKDGAHTVVLARGDHFADALAGTPLAYMYDAPILLTESGKLPPATRAALQQLRTKHVVILGGAKAVSANVELQLRQMGVTHIDRIDGTDRYETAAMIADELGVGESAVIVSGENFADALVVAPYAARHGIPILLTRPSQLPEATEEALQDVAETLVIGGSKAVADEVFEKLPAPRRIDGKNRYETAVRLIDELRLPTVEVFLATGRDFADALTGSALAAREGAPVLLVETKAVPEAVLTWLETKGIHFATVLGGPKAVSDHAAEQFKDLLNEEVQFNDPQLERAVRDALSKPKAPITRSDMGALQELLAVGGIEDLSGLELASNLKYLYLLFNEIEDISVLQHLTQLEELSLWGNRVKDITPLSALTELRLLDLEDNHIRDLSPLQEMDKLFVLYAGYNEIEDISPLAGMHNLELLFLGGNRIEDISALAGLDMLFVLDLTSNRIRSVPQLDLPNLLAVSLADNELTDISWVADLEQLEELLLDFNRISNIEPLGNMTRLRYLGLSSNHIADLSPLSKLTGLRELYLGHNEISDLSPLSNLKNLMALAINNNQIQDLSPLSGLNQLIDLDASGNRIQNVLPLSQLKQLHILYLDNNQIQNVSPLQSLNNLLVLSLALNEIAEISPLGTLTMLDMLDIHDNNIKSIEALKNLEQLYLLDASKNNIEDLSPLQGKQNLALLLLSHNRIKDLSPVSNMQQLWALLAVNNEIEDLKPLVDHVEKGGFLWLGDVRGNKIDLSEGSQQAEYVDLLEMMGVELYYLPQREMLAQAQESFDEEQKREELKAERVEELFQQLRKQKGLKPGLIERLRDREKGVERLREAKSVKDFYQDKQE
ncbi:hypothetical protein GCM10010965_27720 [Caldalkalibacillus thermarum]|uniref:cell wall-binding repeat-containing protein n=1 Tax=Caldalkalibacillus thermarum TaxID=296745 RepID=UPI001664B85D|nr:cell wall-binding repeat-containing protein [Caldalkalibacillus thermarum]GGK33328.1 hypothetical protein GCM10010965_27720 [Caldalkalibacillus thermarum]